MGPKPKPSFSFLTSSLELHPKLKLLLNISLSNRRPPRDLFDNINSYYYYNSYVKPKVARVLKDKSSTLRVYATPSYMIYEIVLYHEVYRSRSFYYYIFGVDNDRVFVNRVNGAPDSYIDFIKVDNIEFRLIDNNAVYGIMGYRIDLGDKEDIVIDITPNPITNIRVQGDLVLQLTRLNENNLREVIGPNRILRQLDILMVDLINRILIDYGFTTDITLNNIILHSIAPRNNDLVYLRRLSTLLYKELKELFGDKEVELQVDQHYTLYEIRVKGGFNCRLFCALVRGGFGNKYNHIRVNVDCNLWWLGPSELYNELFKEVINSLNSLPPSTYEFNIGNHYVKINNAKSLSFSYRPSKQPITLDENTINVINPLTFIVTPSSTIELIHREHGLKTIRFNNSYIVRFTHVETHNDYLRERNRVILRNLEL
jgi:hypothetical protein